VIERCVKNFGAMREEEAPSGHGETPADRGRDREAVKARTSG
jgi:hypothetical protein